MNPQRLSDPHLVLDLVGLSGIFDQVRVSGDVGVNIVVGADEGGLLVFDLVDGNGHDGVVLMIGVGDYQEGTRSTVSIMSPRTMDRGYISRTHR